MEVSSPQNISSVKDVLSRGEWTIAPIWPLFHQALVSALSKRDGLEPSAIDDAPLWWLASAYYRRAYAPASERIPKPRKIAFDVNIVDRTTSDIEFWDATCKALIPNSTLGKLSDLGAKALEEALRDLVRYSPDLEQLFSTYVNNIVVYSGPKSKYSAASQPHYAGCIFLHEELIAHWRLASSLLDELAHQELFCLNLVDRLVTPQGEKSITYAPLQETARPTIARVHACNALYRMLQFLKATNSTFAPEVERMLTETLTSFQQGDLTEFGTFLTREVYGNFLNRRQDDEYRYRHLQ